MTHPDETIARLAAYCAVSQVFLAGTCRQQVEGVLRAPRGHVSHPLRWVLEGALRPGSLQGQVLGNTECALRWVIGSGASQEWKEQQQRALVVPDTAKGFSRWYDAVADVAAALAEVRAWGYLGQCGLTVTRLRSPKPDFLVSREGDQVDVEVTVKLMSKDEAEGLAAFHSSPVTTEELLVRPAGSPKVKKLKDGTEVEIEFTVDNLVHKFSQKAQEKNRQLREDKPSLLWIDLQFEDWWSLHPDEAWPLYVTNRGRFHTGGVWLAFYGRQGIPLLDSESIQNGVPPATRGIEHTSLRYPGYFQSKDARASAVVISWPSSTVLFENPWAPNPLPRPILERLLQLRWFDWPRSWVRPFWKEPTAGLTDLLARVCSALDEITDISQIAQLDW